MKRLTIRNVPDEIYQRLKADAARNGRSLNRETIAQLQASFQTDEPGNKAPKDR
ncbi:MAG TPA: Arc family DNA-binding protein [Tepidiformaceae bacterium]|nr:Arc family DNA-binding protein [Tepidiformaceae bacterium]